MHLLCSWIFNIIQYSKIQHNAIALKIILAKKEINKECRVNEQCTGTENANTCFKEGKDENEKGLCTCNDQYDLIDGMCLKGNVYCNL